VIASSSDGLKSAATVTAIDSATTWIGGRARSSAAAAGGITVPARAGARDNGIVSIDGIRHLYVGNMISNEIA
jgi:hypothetical protein